MPSLPPIVPALLLAFVRTSPAAEGAPSSTPTSSLTFDDRRYAYSLTLADLPPCPGLLDTAFSLDTMRRLTTFVDTIEVLEEAADGQVLRVEYGTLGIHGALVYHRRVDRGAGTMEIRLLSYETNLPLLPLPTSFVAGYRVTHEADHTTLVYRQDAALPGPVALYHQAFIRGRMRRFEATLGEIVAESCP